MKKCFLTSFILLSACSIGQRTPTAVYNIEPTLAVEQSSCKTGTTIQISGPTTSPGLEGRRVAVINDAKLDYYTGIRWAASAAEMTQQVLVESFEKSGAFKNVSTDIDGVDAQYALLTDIRDFQVTDAKNPTVKLRFVSKLVKGNSIAATIPVEREVTPTANKTADIVDAFAKATADVSADVVKAVKGKLGCKK